MSESTSNVPESDESDVQGHRAFTDEPSAKLDRTQNDDDVQGHRTFNDGDDDVEGHLKLCA